MLRVSTGYAADQTRPGYLPVALQLHHISRWSHDGNIRIHITRANAIGKITEFSTRTLRHNCIKIDAMDEIDSDILPTYAIL